MGSPNQLLFIERYAAGLRGPFLETGSRDYGNTQDLRRLFATRGDYVGVDMLAGQGVDVVLDLSGHFEIIDEALGGRRFGTIFCLSVLEHCENPFAVAKNLVGLLAPGGKICVSAPFAFKIHAYPDDFWRFTPSGIRRLFAGVDFPDEQAAWTTPRRGDFRPIDRHVGRIPFSLSSHWQAGKRLRGLSAKALSLLAKVGILRWLAGYRYVLAPTDILMIGTRIEDK